MAAALGLVGCGDDESAQTPPVATPAPITRPPTVTAPPDSAPTAPLPPPAALTDVMARIADPNIPGVEKLDAIEMATPDDAVAMDKFGQALRDGGLTPTTFEAKDLTWADDSQGGQQGAQPAVLAMITIRTADADAGEFTFPMEFHFADGRWKLTRDTADALLQLGDVPAPTPTP
ncbi:hypothetical protein K3G64_18955 [Mycobacterium sp. IDR2000157661]|nr:hypothetical protein K3G64_18955 [Mycobacterium sp. IDR2000157661]